MWLLSSSRAELQYFVSPDAVEGGYAILSHVWGQEEQTFQDLQHLRAKCAQKGQNPRDLACEKIKRSCELAERHGHRWVWIDTCCIDKTSSAELSEAINSMFRYYALSRVCYAFLNDVDADKAFHPSLGHQPGWGQFHASRWHCRGWTLQELVAPRLVLFLSKEWETMGTKVDLAPEIEKAAHIPVSLLTLQRSLDDFTIGERMSWAVERRTTRLEDEAYCLLGIFDINMPTLYGEGSKAFQRLQEEIMKKSADTTLFAWGSECMGNLAGDPGRPRDADSYSLANFGLFATSPRMYKTRDDRTVRYSPHGLLDQSDSQATLTSSLCGGRVVTLSITPHGVMAHLPVVEFGSYTLADLCWRDQEGFPILLVLSPVPADADQWGPTYAVGVYPNPAARLVFLGLRDSMKDACTTRVWSDIYIIQSAPLEQSPVLRIPPIPLNHALRPPFRFPEHNIQTLASSSQPCKVFVDKVQLPWTGEPPATFTIWPSSGLLDHFLTSYRTITTIQVGMCSLPSAKSTSLHALDTSKVACPALWANAQYLPENEVPHVGHRCPGDHVATWPDLRKMFVCEEPNEPGWWEAFTLAFTPCPMNPNDTLVLHAWHRAIDFEAPDGFTDTEAVPAAP
ncbi:HET-domain-containing protein [Lentinus brumalis]|uniref:HET-domain-containing protein n=1 Tax=Lentinus brumalis TaxID=2498619 RepID=A0A371CT39_9APHY|nr:HET-domain-containing protein [Polyporus brumalis]